MATYTSPRQSAERAGATLGDGAHEGLRAGLVAATSVWTWMLAADVAARAPLRTPVLLGRGLLSLVVPDVSARPGVAVAAFTVAHYALWIGVGALVLRVVRTARQTPSVLAAAMFGMILLQLATIVVSAIASHSRLGVMAWAGLGLGNVIGWSAVWWYAIRRHHELRDELAHASDDED
jgi:hypothetical protein